MRQFVGVLPDEYKGNFYVYGNSIYKVQDHFDPQVAYHYDKLVTASELPGFVREVTGGPQQQAMLQLSTGDDYAVQVSNLFRLLLEFYDQTAASARDGDTVRAYQLNGAAYFDSGAVTDLFGPVKERTLPAQADPFTLQVADHDNLVAKLKACQVRIAELGTPQLLLRLRVGCAPQAAEAAFGLVLVDCESSPMISYVLRNNQPTGQNRPFYYHLLPYTTTCCRIFHFVLDKDFSRVHYYRMFCSRQVEDSELRKVGQYVEKLLAQQKVMDDIRSDEATKIKEMIREKMSQNQHLEDARTNALAASLTQTNEALNDEVKKSYQNGLLERYSQVDGTTYDPTVTNSEATLRFLYEQQDLLTPQQKMDVLRKQQSLINYQRGGCDANDMSYGPNRTRATRQGAATKTVGLIHGLDVSKMSTARQSFRVSGDERLEDLRYCQFNLVEWEGGRPLFTRMLVPAYLRRYVPRFDMGRLMDAGRYAPGDAELGRLLGGCSAGFREFVDDILINRLQKLNPRSSNLLAAIQYQPFLHAVAKLGLRLQVQGELAFFQSIRLRALFVQHCADAEEFLRCYVRLCEDAGVFDEVQRQGGWRAPKSKPQSKLQTAGGSRRPKSGQPAAGAATKRTAPQTDEHAELAAELKALRERQRQRAERARSQKGGVGQPTGRTAPVEARPCSPAAGGNMYGPKAATAPPAQPSLAQRIKQGRGGARPAGPRAGGDRVFEHADWRVQLRAGRK